MPATQLLATGAQLHLERIEAVLLSEREATRGADQVRPDWRGIADVSQRAAGGLHSRPAIKLCWRAM